MSDHIDIACVTCEGHPELGFEGKRHSCHGWMRGLIALAHYLQALHAASEVVVPKTQCPFDDLDLHIWVDGQNFPLQFFGTHGDHQLRVMWDYGIPIDACGKHPSQSTYHLTDYCSRPEKHKGDCRFDGDAQARE